LGQAKNRSLGDLSLKIIEGATQSGAPMLYGWLSVTLKAHDGLAKVMASK